jgi:hypothetical protein
MTYDFKFVNNVLFNWRHRTVDGGDKGSEFNIINNYYKPGPVAPDAEILYRLLRPDPTTYRTDPTPRYGKPYFAGNIVEGNAAVTKDNWNG